ncbi:DNA-binding response regulator [Geomicrobium sp. JCM 19039]|uniref:response regulator transcription factor n=1 Tax=Geomicrobium sp. JCM 19039 TaxID=1460636 RepID=UPI00045F42C8|nr:response regulator transcription factor [Geomicrobium sp. JCM 19039]GAK10787.1 two-component response regulator [Geomicrobium sp. JCM 19039]
MIRLLLAEDQVLLRDAIQSLLQLSDHIDIVASTGNGSEALQLAATEHVDVALLDIEMPGLTGIQVAEQLKKGEEYDGKVALLTTFSRPGYIEKAMIANVDGYLLKDEPIETLIESIVRIHEGERVISTDLQPLLFSLETNPLNEREVMLLHAVKEGLSTEQIAIGKHLSEGTVRNYLSSALQKLHVTHRHEAVRIAEEKGWM